MQTKKLELEKISWQSRVFAWFSEVFGPYLNQFSSHYPSITHQIPIKIESHIATPPPKTPPKSQPNRTTGAWGMNWKLAKIGKKSPSPCLKAQLKNPFPRPYGVPCRYLNLTTRVHCQKMRYWKLNTVTEYWWHNHSGITDYASCITYLKHDISSEVKFSLKRRISCQFSFY